MRAAQRWMHLLSVVLVVTGLSSGLAACGDNQPKVVTIGIINLLPIFDTIVDGYKEGMTSLGYKENETVRYVYPGPTPDTTKLEAAAQSLVDAKVDLILAITTPANLAVQKVVSGTTIPVIFTSVTDPVASGLVQQADQPGRNFTGITAFTRAPDFEARRLELLVQLAPQVKQVYIPYNPEIATVVQALEQVKASSAGLGVEIITTEIRTAPEADAAISNLPPEVDSIFIMAPDTTAASAFTKMVTVSQELKLPLATTSTYGATLGGVMGFGPDTNATGKQAARLTDKVLKGANPATIPIESPEIYLAIHLKVAQSLNIAVSDDMLRQAQQIIR